MELELKGVLFFSIEPEMAYGHFCTTMEDPDSATAEHQDPDLEAGVSIFLFCCILRNLLLIQGFDVFFRYWFLVEKFGRRKMKGVVLIFNFRFYGRKLFSDLILLQLKEKILNTEIQLWCYSLIEVGEGSTLQQKNFIYNF